MKNQSKVSPDGVSRAQPRLRNTGHGYADAKRQGHIAELAFMHKVAELGFGVTKPSGDVEHYDFILDSGCRLWRVQVKSTRTRRKRRHSYDVKISHGYAKRTYTEDEIDFVVAYIVPVRAWYVIPVCALTRLVKINVNPRDRRSRGRFECYRDAWCLMACPRHGPSRPEITVQRRCSSSDHCPLTTDH